MELEYLYMRWCWEVWCPSCGMGFRVPRWPEMFSGSAKAQVLYGGRVCVVLADTSVAATLFC